MYDELGAGEGVADAVGGGALDLPLVTERCLVDDQSTDLVVGDHAVAAAAEHFDAIFEPGHRRGRRAPHLYTQLRLDDSGCMFRKLQHQS